MAECCLLKKIFFKVSSRSTIYSFSASNISFKFRPAFRVVSPYDWLPTSSGFTLGQKMYSYDVRVPPKFVEEVIDFKKMPRKGLFGF